MTRQRWWILIGVVGVVAIVAAWSSLPPVGIVVETATVTRGTVRVTVDEEGRTRLRDRYVVATPVAGRIQRLTVKEGDQVEANDVIGRMWPAPADPRAVGVTRGQLAAAEARRLEVQAQVQTAMATADQKLRDLERTATLADAGAVSQDALEQARLAAATARQQQESRQAALRAADAEVEAARAALIGLAPGDAGGAVVDVRAPTSGRVLRVVQQSARVVEAGAPLVEIGDAAGLEVVVDVLSEDAVRIEPGHPVSIEQWGGDVDLQGAVRLIEPEAFTKVSALGVEEQRVNVIVDLIDPPATLGAGYRLEARIVTWTGDDVLNVPSNALFQARGAWAVFVVQEGRAERRAVVTGHQSSDAVEILGGLREGEQVILYPSALIESGVRVRTGTHAP